LPSAFAGGNADDTDERMLADFSTALFSTTALKINRLLLIFWPLRDHSDYTENTYNSLNSMKN